MRQFFPLLGAAIAASLVAAPAAHAQEKSADATPPEAPSAASAPAEKRAIEASDYAQWERLGYSSELSPDGRWLAYTVSTVGGEGELRLRMLATDSTEVLALRQTTRSWKLALALPLLTSPQILLVAYLLIKFG